MSSRPTMVGPVADGRGHPTAQSQRLTQWCAGAACAIALVAVAGWVLDLRFLAGQWGTHLPMPPSVALGVLLLGGGISSLARWPSRYWSRSVALAGAILAALLGLLVLVEFVSGLDSGLELALARTGAMVGTAALGHMSPISAASLLLESAALVLMLHLTRWRVAAALALLLAGLTTVIHLVVLVGYLYGAPLLYGGPIRPVAAPAALAFVLLGAGQGHLLLARVPALRAWQRGTMRGILVRAFLPAVLLFVILEGWADTWREEAFRSTNPALWHALLASAIGGLFVVMIAWVAHRTGDEIESANTALRASEQRFHLAVNATNDGMWDFDLLDGTARFNERYVAAFGKPPENAEPWGWWTDHVHPDDRDRTLSSYDAAVNGSGDVWKCEYRFRKIDGTWADISDRAHIARDSPGKAQYIIGALSDLTESKRAEAALQDNEQYIRLLLDSITEGFYGVDTTGNCILVNRACLRMLGYDNERELLGRHIHELIHHTRTDGTPYPAIECRMYGVLGSGSAVINVDDEVFWRRDGTPVPVEYSSYPILRNGQLMGAVASFFDITERNQGKQKQSRLEAQLQQAQKMESVGRLAGGVAHDFNNMMGVILGYADFALKQVDAAQPLHADLQEIHKAATRAADLTRQLLAFARQQTIAPKVLDLNDAVASMLKMLRRLLGEDIVLRWLPGAALWPVMADPSQVDQILANLCVNARDAISGVGKLTIETGNSTIGTDYCAARAGSVPGEYVRLVVGDDGCGMGKDTLAHIFEPFYTTKAVGHGTGLGLATVYGIVKQNDGFIDVASEPNHGATFTVYLPRHVGKVGQARTEGAAKPVPGGHETILLVEDEPAFLTLTKTMLEQQGYTVMSAGTPGEAIRLATTYTGEIHLLMTDVVMPEMNGRVLAKNLLAVHPLVKRLFMSGYTADVIAHHGVLDEGLNFIQKPFSAKDLATKVRDALDAQN